MTLMTGDMMGEGWVITAPCIACATQFDLPLAMRVHVDAEHPFTEADKNRLRSWATDQCGCLAASEDDQ
jgi:hypothetical protein